MTVSWHIITGEYPPQSGGVADYTRLVARGLSARGHDVHVWAPESTEPVVEDRGVEVHRLHGGFGPAGLARLTRGLSAFRRRRLLIQYVPNAYGMRAMNVPLCAWTWSRPRDEVWVMFHEVAYPFGSAAPLRHHLLAAVTHVMASMVLARADRAFVSATAWRDLLEPLPLRPAVIEWLPVPSNVPAETPTDTAQSVRTAALRGRRGPLIGHFGTYGRLITEMFEDVLIQLLASDPDRCALLVGRGGERARSRIGARAVDVAERTVALGEMPLEQIGVHLRACDLLVQPYPDGVTTRRGSLMAGLALGIPVVTNAGPLTESTWHRFGAVRLAPDPSTRAIVTAAEALLHDDALRARVGEQGRAVYAAEFSIERTLEILCSTEGAPRVPASAPAPLQEDRLS